MRLDKCKHCGSEPELVSFPNPFDKTQRVGYVRCPVCGIQTAYLKVDEAVRRWNLRPGSAERDCEHCANKVRGVCKKWTCEFEPRGSDDDDS